MKICTFFPKIAIKNSLIMAPTSKDWLPLQEKGHLNRLWELSSEIAYISPRPCNFFTTYYCNLCLETPKHTFLETLIPPPTLLTNISFNLKVLFPLNPTSHHDDDDHGGWLLSIRLDLVSILMSCCGSNLSRSNFHYILIISVILRIF